MDETVRARLIALSEEKFRDFSSSLVPGCGDMLGVRVPLLRALAREAVRSGEWRAMLSSGDDRWFEERVLRGMLIGLAPMPLERRLELVRDFVPCIDNWAVCDIFCAGLKFAAGNRGAVWPLLEECLASQQTYALRFAAVMLLDHYLCDEYIGPVLERLAAVCSEAYYVRMAVAWAVSVCYVRYPERTLALLEAGRLDRFTHNKSIRKICESLRVAPEAKAALRRLKR